MTVIVSGPLPTLSEENYFSSLTGEGAEVPKRSRAEIAALMKAHKPTGFDPIPFVRQMRIPSVWIFGGNDDSVPVDLSIDALHALQKEGYPFELAWFPMGNHQLWETSDGSRQYAPLIHRYVPHYFDTTLRWFLVLSNRSARRERTGLAYGQAQFRSECRASSRAAATWSASAPSRCSPREQASDNTGRWSRGSGLGLARSASARCPLHTDRRRTRRRGNRAALGRFVQSAERIWLYPNGH